MKMANLLTATTRKISFYIELIYISNNLLADANASEMPLAFGQMRFTIA
jgi:hypothetical protein